MPSTASTAVRPHPGRRPEAATADQLLRRARTDDEDDWSDDSDDTADFESILDLAKASGALPEPDAALALPLPARGADRVLQRTFYKGRLVTFPSRHSDGPDVGVELFRVDGTYRRGSSRDNPDEAAKVAERVLHHYDTRPASASAWWPSVRRKPTRSNRGQ